MRVLVVHPGPSFSVADVHHGLVRGLRQCLGAENVASFNLDDRLEFYSSMEMTKNGETRKVLNREGAILLSNQSLYGFLYQYMPDVVVFTSGFFISEHVWNVMGMRPHHTVLWCTESPYEDDRQLPAASYADTVVLNDPVNIQTFRQVNPRTYYFPHSYDPDVHCPGEPNPDWAVDFGWAGTAFKSRISFFQRMSWKGITAKLGGNWQLLSETSKLNRFLIGDRTECLDNADTVRLYRSVKMSANLYRREASDGGTNAGWAIGPREVELAACGTFMLRESRPEGDELFPDAPIFSDPKELGDLIRWWAANDPLREKTAQVNREAIADRTFRNSAARLLGLIDSAPKRI